jgi:hypothetical protein
VSFLARIMREICQAPKRNPLLALLLGSTSLTAGEDTPVMAQPGFKIELFGEYGEPPAGAPILAVAFPAAASGFYEKHGSALVWTDGGESSCLYSIGAQGELLARRWDVGLQRFRIAGFDPDAMGDPQTDRLYLIATSESFESRDSSSSAIVTLDPLGRRVDFIANPFGDDAVIRGFAFQDRRLYFYSDGPSSASSGLSYLPDGPRFQGDLGPTELCFAPAGPPWNGELLGRSARSSSGQGFDELVRLWTEDDRVLKRSWLTRPDIGRPGAFTCARGGAFGRDLLVADPRLREVRRIDAQGRSALFLRDLDVTHFAWGNGGAFGQDLYVCSKGPPNRIYRISTTLAQAEIYGVGPVSLAIEGPPAIGALPFRLRIGQAPASSRGFLLVSFFSGSQPMPGGWTYYLGPLALPLIPLCSDALGTVELEGRIPAGTEPTELHLQVLFLPSAGSDLALQVSNRLSLFLQR